MGTRHMSRGFTQYLKTGFTLLDAARHDAASSAFRQATVLAPGETIALYGVGFTALRRENWKASARVLGWASVAARQDTTPRVITEVHLARGISLRSGGFAENATNCFRRAALMEPHNPGVHANHARGHARGHAMGHARELDASARARMAGWATIAAPGSADYWNGLGLARVDAGDPSGAAKAYRHALVLAPDHPHGWNNLAILHKRGDKTGRAVLEFARARVLNPGDVEILLNLGRNLLLTGDLVRGWECLEAPWRWSGLRPRGGGFALPIWNGQPLPEGRLLLWSEEKIGEELMFSTLLEDVARLARAPVTVLCNPRIADLLSLALPEFDIRGWDLVAPPPTRVADHVACYPLEFVGRFVRRAFSDFPAPRPILKRRSPPSEQRRGGVPRVGIHWRSVNPFVGEEKSTSLVDWEPVLSVPNIEFISLQYGPVTAEISDARQRFGQAPTIPAGIDQLTDMHAFTELVAGLDLVICVSSTSAHVAGSLGLPCWVLLPRGAGLSWFWFEERGDSPWYPGCRLYRQDAVGKWDSVLERVARDLATWSDGGRRDTDRPATNRG